MPCGSCAAAFNQKKRREMLGVEAAFQLLNVGLESSFSSRHRSGPPCQPMAHPHALSAHQDGQVFHDTAHRWCNEQQGSQPPLMGAGCAAPLHGRPWCRVPPLHLSARRRGMRFRAVHIPSFCWSRIKPRSGQRLMSARSLLAVHRLFLLRNAPWRTADHLQIPLLFQRPPSRRTANSLCLQQRAPQALPPGRHQRTG